jgi:hypothetical protein
MTVPDGDRVLLSRLVGHWEGRLSLRLAAGRAFRDVRGTSDNRWVLGGRFVEMTFRALDVADLWSAVFYIGHDSGERRHVLVSLDSNDRTVTMRLGEWTGKPDHVVLTSEHVRARCELTPSDLLKVQLVDQIGAGEECVRFAGDYRRLLSAARPREGEMSSRRDRRFVIA